MGEPRYYVREQIVDADDTVGLKHRAGRGVSIVFVRDRLYCCADVARITTRSNESVAAMRQRAHALCYQLNAEHAALLATEGMASR